MNIGKLDECIKEAKRFIEKAEAAKRRLKSDNWAIYGCMESASAKRSSMDLTRALADLRKPA